MILAIKQIQFVTNGRRVERKGWVNPEQVIYITNNTSHPEIYQLHFGNGGIINVTITTLQSLFGSDVDFSVDEEAA